MCFWCCKDIASVRSLNGSTWSNSCLEVQWYIFDSVCLTIKSNYFWLYVVHHVENTLVYSLLIVSWDTVKAEKGQMATVNSIFHELQASYPFVQTLNSPVLFVLNLIFMYFPHQHFHPFTLHFFPSSSFSKELCRQQCMGHHSNSCELWLCSFHDGHEVQLQLWLLIITI